jgi:hypothetical protein
MHSTATELPLYGCQLRLAGEWKKPGMPIPSDLARQVRYGANHWLQEGRLAQLEEQMNLVLDQGRYVSLVLMEA